MIKIYYGLSGTFKGTTISAADPTSRVMRSAIKSWKHYQFGSFSGLTQDNDLTYGLLHLVRLREFLEESVGPMSIERSISDCLFYYFNSDEFGEKKELEVEKIKELIKEEEILLQGKDVKKILLIQRDEDFIKNVVLQEPTRQKTFKGDPRLYMDLQERYVEWTKKYNKIDEVIEIYNAKDYLEGVLGIEFKNN